jgi:hypothetical protein
MACASNGTGTCEPDNACLELDGGARNNRRRQDVVIFAGVLDARRHGRKCAIYKSVNFVCWVNRRVFDQKTGVAYDVARSGSVFHAGSLSLESAAGTWRGITGSVDWNRCWMTKGLRDAVRRLSSRAPAGTLKDAMICFPGEDGLFNGSAVLIEDLVGKHHRGHSSSRLLSHQP